MPELPEVENVVRALQQCVAGKTIRDVNVLRPQLVGNSSGEPFRTQVRARRIDRVRRRAKFILMELTGGRTLLVHLRMTGGFVYAHRDRDLPATTRLILYLNSSVLGFTDRRNLGVMKLVRTEDLARLKELRRLGLEPLEAEFTVERFHQLLGRSRRPVKEFLLDQTRVVGLGNIYAAEALHRAHIDPRRTARMVAGSKRRVRALQGSIVQTLQQAVKIQRRGILPHFEVVGVREPSGRPHQSFQVYGREGDGCFNCGARIRRIKQGGRSTYYCPRCQK